MRSDWNRLRRCHVQEVTKYVPGGEILRVGFTAASAACFISWLSGTTEVVPFPRNSLREEIALVERFDENLDAPNLAARNFYL